MRATFLLLAYNQEPYAADAVRAALAQQGEPLSILISDDASTDRTFEVIKAAVAGYRGPHEVNLNRNPRNLGIARHINSCMERVRTEYVIGAAADDISLPDRAARILDTFQATDAVLIHSRFEEINRNGQSIQGLFPERAAYFLRNTSARNAALRMGLYVGATGAWHRSLFEQYGDIGDGCYEDLILGFRAALERRVGFIDEALVKYRVGIGVSSADRRRLSAEDWRVSRLKELARINAVLTQRFRDTARSSHPERKAISADLSRALRLNALREDSYELSPFALLRENLRSLPLALRALKSERRKRSASIGLE